MCRFPVVWRYAAGAALVVSVAACSGGGEALQTTPATVPVVTAAANPATTTSPNPTLDVTSEMTTLDHQLADLDQTLEQIDADLGADEGDPTK